MMNTKPSWGVWLLWLTWNNGNKFLLTIFKYIQKLEDTFEPFWLGTFCVDGYDLCKSPMPYKYFKIWYMVKMIFLHETGVMFGRIHRTVPVRPGWYISPSGTPLVASFSHYSICSSLTSFTSKSPKFYCSWNWWKRIAAAKPAWLRDK